MRQMYFNEEHIEDAFESLNKLITYINENQERINDIYNLVQAGWSQNGAGKKATEDLGTLRKELNHGINEIHTKKKELRNDWELMKAVDRSYK
ncbi:hypothetical protein COE15_02305 [Bacillus cereus]|uniref:hypothetical protein n=1 Tax=unclassified Bacillus (in: firmicutes) TaxID=185979 RepID=UPI000478815A|nr:MULTISPECIES: hypothetical protein [unclassified Bacillus (in: firmicutes)]PFE06014.1 hypothetical protein CN288_04545 [Bacillus sp. AFS023182]PGY04117.1 hypothetical protein COE15_02305 [Bacillus cereus]SDY39667.1 hypothetical protein SAMN04488156_101193 [Bacillus sp. 166amftsu]